MNGIIMTTEYNYAYNLRHKLRSYGFKAEYINKFDLLVKYFMDNKEGVIFIKSNSARLQNYIKQYSLLQQNKNYIFVFLTSEDAKHIKSDDKTIFFSSYENIQELIPILNKSVCSKLCVTDFISSHQVEQYLTEILTNLKFPTNVMGYSFIRDAVNLMIGDHEYQTCLKSVYDILGKRYNKNISNIEKSIRMAITIFTNSYPEISHCIFEKDKISNSEFLAYLIDKIKELYCRSLDSK